MRRWRTVLAVAALGASVGSCRAETISEAWRSPFGTPRSVAVYPTDGSCWAAIGSRVYHFSAAGDILSEAPMKAAGAVSVNAADGSCWASDLWGGWTVHLAADGSELGRATGVPLPRTVSVNSADGSCWVGGWGWVAHYSQTGDTLWEGSPGGYNQPNCVSVNSADGSCWVSAPETGEAVHLASDGSEIWRGPAVPYAGWVAVNPTDGSCWVSGVSGGTGAVGHLSSAGELLWSIPVSATGWTMIELAVDVTDGSCWVVGTAEGVIHLAADGTEMWRGTPPGGGSAVSVNPEDGCYWLAGQVSGQVSRFTADHTEVWQSPVAFSAPISVSFSPVDNALWVGDPGRDEVIHLGEDGTELWRGGEGIGSPAAVSANAADGSCWVVATTARLAHFSREGAELYYEASPAPSLSQDVSVNASDGSCWIAEPAWDCVSHVSVAGEVLWSAETFPVLTSLSVNRSDGSCWVGDFGSALGNDAVVHLSAEGSELWRSATGYHPIALAVNEADGSCWVADCFDYDVAHLSAEGEELWRGGSFFDPEALAVDWVDGSCWVADTAGAAVVHLAADGTELGRVSGLYYPVDVSVSIRDGSCWVADGNGQIVHLVIPVGVFHDVPPGHWAVSQVEACAGAGIVSGYADGLYYPDNPVTRDQMAVFISRAMAGGEANVPSGPGTATFSDVPTDYWAFKYVEYCVQQDVVGGYPDGLYHPTDPVDRGQMAVFIARAMAGGEANVPDPGCTGPVFPDVPCDFWARKYVQYIQTAGVTGGYPDGSYHPEITVTRDQMAVFVARAFGLL